MIGRPKVGIVIINTFWEDSFKAMPWSGESLLMKFHIFTHKEIKYFNILS